MFWNESVYGWSDEGEEMEELDSPFTQSKDKIDPKNIELGFMSKLILRSCLKEIESYLINTAASRAAHFGSKEVSHSDMLAAYTSLQGPETLQKIAELVNNRMLLNNLKKGEL